MLNEIILENFLFMPSAVLKFSDGLNVITGETGAGKSVLLEAIKLLLGKKARPGLVLQGHSMARIQAEFNIKNQSGLIELLENAGLQNEEAPELLFITRTFKEEGLGRVMVNGVMSTASFLKEIGPHLIEIHGQNEHQTLLLSEVQRGLLDRTGHEEHKKNLIELNSAYIERQKLIEQLKELETTHKHSEEHINELQSTIQELTALNLTMPHEDVYLKDELKRLSHAEQILTSLQAAFSRLTGADEVAGATLLLFKAAENLKRIAEFDPKIDNLYQRLYNTYYELKSFESELEALTETIDLDSEHLNRVQSRLSEISRVCRKYSTDFSGLFELKDRVDNELSELFAPDSTKEKLENRLSEVEKRFFELCAAVSKERKRLSESLNKAVSAEMADLGFNSAIFKAELKAVSPNAHGAEEVEFCVSLNPGSDGGPLKKIASGGELSRVALAIKKVLAKSDNLSTLIFDEIDAGIGGTTAQAVASSLKALSKEKQVILVTHLHQIAKEGARHFIVEKSVCGNKTKIEICEVEGEARIKEIARMLGDTDKSGIAFAESLLNSTKP